MKYILVLCLSLLSLCKTAWCQTNVELIDQLVPESQSEHTRQNTAKNEQVAVSANEQVNSQQTGTLKTTYRNIQSRFHTLGLVIDAGEIALEATPLVNEIMAQQQQIISLSVKQPVLAALALQSEAQLANQASLLVEYAVGVILSIGDINQMKASDRKMLFGYVVTELRQLDGASRGLLNNMNNFAANLNWKTLDPFSNFINQDKSVADDIMRDAKALK